MVFLEKEAGVATFSEPYKKNYYVHNIICFIQPQMGLLSSKGAAW